MDSVVPRSETEVRRSGKLVKSYERPVVGQIGTGVFADVDDSSEELEVYNGTFSVSATIDLQFRPCLLNLRRAHLV